MTTKLNGSFLLVAMPMIVSLLGGCASAPEPVVPPPVAAAPPVITSPVVAAPAVVTPAPVVAAQPTVVYPRVLNYPEGRYQLYGDATNGYYWVWIPAGSAALAPPAPPAVPAVTTTPSAAVVVTQVPREVTYPNGRYQLYGDATTGYYWVWVPTGFTPPTPPAPWRVSQNP